MTVVRNRRRLGTLLLFVLVVGARPETAAQSGRLEQQMNARVAAVLHGRQIVRPKVETRGAEDLYQAVVAAVPLVVSRSGAGSSVVIAVNQAQSTAFIVTNEHVVRDAFEDDAGRPTVGLLFYAPELADAPFKSDAIGPCLRSPDRSAWCSALRRSWRLASVLATDPSRDLALLSVRDMPSRGGHVAPARLDTVRPGASVLVVGHPLGLLWT